MSTGTRGAGGGLTSGPSRGRASKAPAPRETWIKWFQAKLELAKAITPKEGEKVEKISEDERMRRALGMSKFEKRPTLLYFHYPHETEKQAAMPAGKASKKLCAMIDDETAARWAILYHCVEVDMASSDAKLLKRFGAGKQPSFAVISRDLTVIASSEAAGKKGFLKLLKTSLPLFKDYWQGVQDQIKRQKKKVAEARKLAKKSEERALVRFQDIREYGVRIAKSWEAARSEAEKLQNKLLR